MYKTRKFGPPYGRPYQLLGEASERSPRVCQKQSDVISLKTHIKNTLTQQIKKGHVTFPNPWGSPQLLSFNYNYNYISFF